MPDPVIHILLDTPHEALRPGDILAGVAWVSDVSIEEIAALELSVLWYTEGKGDQDMAVHLFQRWEPGQKPPIDPRHPVRFSTQLPRSPLSYDGELIKIRWCVRLRLFLASGEEMVKEKPFRLGHVPRPRVLSS